MVWFLCWKHRDASRSYAKIIKNMFYLMASDFLYHWVAKLSMGIPCLYINCTSFSFYVDYDHMFSVWIYQLRLFQCQWILTIAMRSSSWRFDTERVQISHCSHSAEWWWQSGDSSCRINAISVVTAHWGWITILYLYRLGGLSLLSKAWYYLYCVSRVTFVHPIEYAQGFDVLVQS